MESQEVYSSAKLTDLKAKEASLRYVLEKLLACTSISLAAFLSFLLVPIFPFSISIILAIGLGALTYKVPILSIMLLFFCTMLGFIYQLEMPVMVSLVIFAVLFVLSIRATQPGYILGIACGVIAAVIASTGFYYLAVPLLVAIPLFRARGRNVGSTSAIITFIALYVPLLTYNTLASVPGQVNPVINLLFGQAGFPQKPPIAFNDFNTLFSRLNEVIPWSTSTVNQYLERLSHYFPTFTADSHSGFLIILLGIIVGASIAVAFGLLAFFRWVEKRQEGNRILLWTSPTLAIIGAEILFMILFNFLAGTLDYRSNTDTSLILGFIIAAVALGGLGAFIENWLHGRDLLIISRQTYITMLPDINNRVTDLFDKIQQIRSVCNGIDIISEELSGKKVQQDLAITSQEPGNISFGILKEKVALFKQDEKLLNQSSEELMSKTRRYYADNSQKYREFLEAFARYGYSLGKPLPEIPMAELNTYVLARLLSEQKKLNDLYETAAQTALHQAEEIQKAVVTELDPNLKSVGVTIGSNYYQQKNYLEALDTLQAEFSHMDHIVYESSSLLNEKYVTALHEFHRSLQDTLIPAMDKIGDAAEVARFSALAAGLEDLNLAPTQNIKLIDFIPRIAKTQELAVKVITVLNDLLDRINDIETKIEPKAPAGYNWGKNNEVQDAITRLLSGYQRKGGWSTVNDRIVRIESAIKLIQDSVSTIIQYSQVLEFLINYVNLEFLIQLKLDRQGEVPVTDVPVKNIYAQQYLRLFVENHPGKVFIEGGTGKLLKRN